jgi:hypothetical protein
MVRRKSPFSQGADRQRSKGTAVSLLQVLVGDQSRATHVRPTMHAGKLGGTRYVLRATCYVLRVVGSRTGQTVLGPQLIFYRHQSEWGTTDVMPSQWCNAQTVPPHGLCLSAEYILQQRMSRRLASLQNYLRVLSSRHH